MGVVKSRTAQKLRSFLIQKEADKFLNRKFFVDRKRRIPELPCRTVMSLKAGMCLEIQILSGISVIVLQIN